MRLVHVSDIHWMTPPPLASLLGKRLLGTANLYLRGRKNHFDLAVQRELVAAIVALNPDLVVVSGDLTAQALEAEFILARAELDPVLSTLPTLLIPGNHDVYTRGSQRHQRFHEHLGSWFPGGPVARLDVGNTTVLGLDPCRPHLSASGLLPEEQLTGLAEVLPELLHRRVVLASHYPLVGPDGAPYDGNSHGLRNARDVLAVLRASPVRPVAVLSGHRHREYRVPIDLGDAQVPQVVCGAGGRTHGATLHVLNVATGESTLHRHGDGGFAPAGWVV